MQPEMAMDQRGFKALLDQRTDFLTQFRELGPPDMIIIMREKNSGSSSSFGASPPIKGAKPADGSYTFYHLLGANVTSSAAIAAFASSIAKKKSFKSNAVTRVIYCTYDALSRTDLRIVASFPGGVNCTAISSDGTATDIIHDDVWDQTSLCGSLRSLLYESSDFSGLQRISNDDISFLSTASRLLKSLLNRSSRPKSLNGQIDIQTERINITDHFIVRGISEFFINQQRPDMGIDFFLPLSSFSISKINKSNSKPTDLDPEEVRMRYEIDSILAKCLLEADKEVEAVRVLCNTLTADPYCAPCLWQQTELLLSKSKFHLAVKVAKQAVVAAPLETRTWVLLSRALCDLNDYESALRVLNSAPVITCSKSMDLEIFSTTMSHVFKPKDSIPHNLKEYYTILVRMVNKIGWDRLLELRSNVFIMAEEDKMPMTDTESIDETKTINDERSYSTENTRSFDGGQKETSANTKDGAKNPEWISKFDLNSKNSSEKQIVDHETRKNLCERWLDTLFTCLYKDLRTVLVRSQSTLEEFASKDEIISFAESAMRLEKINLAADAFRYVAEMDPQNRYAWTSLITLYAQQERPAHTLSAVAKLLSIDESNWINKEDRISLQIPLKIEWHMSRLLRQQGLQRMRAALASLGLVGPVETVIGQFLDLHVSEQRMGFDY